MNKTTEIPGTCHTYESFSGDEYVNSWAFWQSNANVQRWHTSTSQTECSRTVQWCLRTLSAGVLGDLWDPDKNSRHHIVRGLPAGVARMEMNHEKVRVKTRFKLTLSTWIKLRESDTRWFTASIFKPSIIWGKKSQCNIISGIQKSTTTLKFDSRVHVSFSKKLGSGDRPPELA